MQQGSKVAALLLGVVVLLAVVLLLSAHAEARAVPHGLRDAMVRSQRRDAPSDDCNTGAWSSGDLVFVSYTPRRKRWWLPRGARRVLNEAYAHMALVLRHPTFGLCLVDAFYDERGASRGTRQADGVVLLQSSHFSTHAPDVFQGDRVRNGSIRVTRLPDALRALNGCVWRRPLAQGVQVDEAAMWEAVHRINAASPPLELGNHSGHKARLANYAARILTGAPLLDATLDGRTARQASCAHTAALLLEVGGAWAGAPHRYNVVLHALAPPAPSELLRRNRVAAGLPPDPQVALANQHILPRDLSSSSHVDTARGLWGLEEYVTCGNRCKVDAFLG